MELTDCQAHADEAFERFVSDEDMTVFGLFGFAGTGKSRMTSRFIKSHMAGKVIFLASPTHKAAHILRGFLRDEAISYTDTPLEVTVERLHASIEWRMRRGLDTSREEAELLEAMAGGAHPVVGTTAQLLGIRPDIKQNQDAHDLKFSKVARGTIETVERVDWVIVDEVSMLSMDHFNMVVKLAKARGAKILVVGDPGQLPPVNAGAIPFERFGNKATLDQVVRTNSSAILSVATAVRNGRDFTGIRGDGVHHVANVAGTFLANLTEPPGEDERDWSVYVAYRNVTVDAVAEAACVKLYGHGRGVIAPGEVVLATNSLMRGRGPVKETLCTNGETLVVEHVGLMGEWGQNVTIRSVSTGKRFDAEYLPESEARNPDSRYNVALRALRANAEMLQKQFNGLRDSGDYDEASRVDQQRRQAWAQYFSLRDDTVLGVQHPFAITSHKSQGSSYCRAFVDATDMQSFDPRSLYVGVTRPKEELVVG